MKDDFWEMGDLTLCFRVYPLSVVLEKIMSSLDTQGAEALRRDGLSNKRAGKRPRLPAVVAAMCLVLLVMSGCGRTSNGLVIESVDNYSLRNGPSLTNSVANGDGFIKGMTVEGSPWSLKTRWTDLNVWDTDFMDPDGKQAKGDDGANFDPPGAAISYFTGHGFCTDGCSTQQSCTTTSACTAPGAGERLPGSCRFSPLDKPRCCYMTDRMAATSGQSDANSGVVNYSSGPVKWGESPTSGGWAQAGTNGGTNLVVLDISCGILPTFWYQALQNAAAGVHMIATLLIAGGDTANVPDRGAAFAKMWAANPEGSVSQAWLDTMSALPLSEGRGINGFGCNIIVAMDGSLEAVNQKINESWTDLRNDNNDAKGNSWYSARWQCNYALPATDGTAWELP